MSVDAVARRAGQAARDDVKDTLDVEAKLRELNVTRVRRRRTKAVATLLAASAAVALVVAVLPRDPVEQGAQAARPDKVPPQVQRCLDYPQVPCGEDVVVVPGRTSYTFKIPRGFSRAPDFGAAPLSIDIFRTGPHRGGLTILEGVRAVGRPQVRGAGPLARWVASRTFLESSPVRHGRLDGFDTWTVRVRPAGVRRGSTSCNGMQAACRAVLAQPARGGWQTGVWDGMTSRYTFLDVPGLGTVALWSWIFEADSRFKDDDALVRSIDFHVPS